MMLAPIITKAAQENGKRIADKLTADEWALLAVFAPLAIYGAFNKQPPAWLNALGAGLTVWQMTSLARRAIQANNQTA